jgi:aminoglycoside phosphotransferase (APT) family kinase protein
LNVLATGISQVPQPFGLDDEGHESLSFIPGEVPNYPLPDWIWSETILDEASSLLRRMHDAAVDVHSEDARWQTPAHMPEEVICHNDCAPYNLVFARGHLVSVIDFDTPAPDELLPRLHKAIGADGLPFDPGEVLEVMAIRLEDLAVYTDARAKQTWNPDFSGHAAMYRRDAVRVRGVSLS